MIYFYCTSWQFFQMIVKWRISPTTEQIMFTFSILLFHFYSHIPYGMWRIPKLKHFVLLRFLLTHPVWDVTLFSDIIKLSSYNFYSHIPCGMWRLVCKIHRRWRNFYSHIPCGMWQCAGYNDTADVCNFYSHIPCGMWHISWQITLPFFHFYSHIPCGMWRKGDYTYVELSNFYSHIPCGMWRYFFALLSCSARFLLTHPVWDVTAIHDDYGAAIAFLLTHPVWDVTPLPYLTL